MKYTIVFCNSFFEVVASGDANFEGIKLMISDLLSSPNWKPGNSLLLDYTKLNAGPLLVSQIKEMAWSVSNVRKELGSLKVAHVVSRDLEFGLIRMWDTFLFDDWDGTADIFWTRDQAVSWLLSTDA